MRLLYSHRGRVVSVDGSRVEVEDRRVTRRLPALPRHLHARVEPEGWESEAKKALAGGIEAVLRYAELLSEGAFTVQRTTKGAS